MATIPTSDRRIVSTTPSKMQVQYQHVDKAVLASAREYPGGRRSTSPDAQINIFDGGWDEDGDGDDDDDDDDEDYVDMAPIQPQRLRAATHTPTSTRINQERNPASLISPNRLLALRRDAPDVIVLPASPQGSLASNSSIRFSRSPSPSPSTDDSEASNSGSEDSSGSGSEDYEELEERDVPNGDFPQVTEIKPRSGSRTSIPSSVVVVTSPPPHPKRQQPSFAGQAARKYLQMHQVARAFATGTQHDRESSTVLQRSSSRVSTRGAQGRISKTRSPDSPLASRSQSVEEIDPHDNNARITEAKQKSKTLDRSLSGIKHSVGSKDENGARAEKELALDDDEKRKTNDGASVMKMISDRRRKSQSLDSKYLQYLEGISKHASAPNSPKSSFDKKKDSKSKKKTKKKSKVVDEDDEEEFKKFTEAVSTISRTSCTDSSPDLSVIGSNTTETSLANFAKEKARVDKLAKKRLQGSSGFASKMSFRKSKTIGKTSLEIVGSSFAESAQAFHEQQKRENDEIILADSSEANSNTFKKEKRKSWRKKHGFSLKIRSKDKITSDTVTPPVTPNDQFSDEVIGTSAGSDPNSKAPPQKKQSLGYNNKESSSLKLKNGRSLRSRATSVEKDNTQPHNHKIMNPTTARSRTLDNRKRGAVGQNLLRMDSDGQMLVLASPKQTSSLHAENSGSNSDASIALDDEFDANKVERAGTLSRLLGRKKGGKLGGDVEDIQESNAAFYNTGSLGRRRTKRGKYATLGSPVMQLRMRHANSRELLLEAGILSQMERFFLPERFQRGFQVHNNNDEEAEMDINELGLAFEAAGRNKYATITGSRTSPYWKKDAKPLKKQESDISFELNRQGMDPSPGLKRRNKSLPLTNSPARNKSAKAKGISSVFSRGLQRTSSGPSSNLGFSDALTEDAIVDVTSERLTTSPFRARKLQVIDPLVEEPCSEILFAAKILHRRLVFTNPDLLQTRDAGDERDALYERRPPESEIASSYPNSVFGQDLVTWLVDQMPIVGYESSESSTNADIRRSACGMLQSLLEEGAISHVRREHHFHDSFLLYQFHEFVTETEGENFNGRPVSTESTVSPSTLSSDVHSTTSTETNDAGNQNENTSRHAHVAAPEHWVPMTVSEQELKDVLHDLQKIAPDAALRMVLRKLPEDRTAEELMMIYQEILHIKALAHLSDSVKRELAGVLKFEFHKKRGKTLFSQGDEGRSWYIIIKGSVDVDIHGQGVVCTLHEGDDFGNLAIINDAPRAATIVLADDNCQLLRVDKHDFVRILKDVEANTVRLKEHDKDVLILQKIHARSSSSDGQEEKFTNNNTKANQRLPVAATPTRSNHRYAISAGTPAKIVEHVVKSLRPWSTAKQSDEAMEDLILMYQVFMSTQDLCKHLMNLYQSEKSEQIDSSKSIKRKVVYFVVRWSHIATHIFYDQPAVGSFLKELKQAVTEDDKMYPNMKEDLARIYDPEPTSPDSTTNMGWITVESSTVQRYPLLDSGRAPYRAIKASDDVMLKVCSANRTYTTVRLPVLSKVSEIISAVAEKQGRDATDLRLIQVQSDGEMYALPSDMPSAATSIGVNSRLFISSPNEKDEITPLDEQRALPVNNTTVLELVGSQEIAEHITQFDWELTNSIHVMEFVHKVFGSHKFNSVTSNIDIFARRFNQLAYWAPTEICSCGNVNKRVHLLRKFIKIAQHLKELQNMNGFMAVMIGLGNQALSRLHSTWDKLPTKYKKLMTEFEAVLDPSRNHRTYRLYVASLRPPMIPYLPLLMKDMTFQHEGNDTKRDGLVNFEKMHMMSNSIRGVIQSCCKPLEMSHAAIASKNFDETRQYARTFGVVADQKLLNQLSRKLESKR